MRLLSFINIVLAGLACLILIGYARYALAGLPSFDGAMNLNTAWSFMQGHGYGFFYNEFFPFPAQTNGPYIFPAGLLMSLCGITPLTTQATNLVYLIGFTITTFWLLRRLTGTNIGGFSGAVILLSAPGLSQFGMNGYGEILMFFWFLVALLTLGTCLGTSPASKARLAIGGVMLALCYLTKTVSLILVFPAFCLFAGLFLWRYPRRRSDLSWYVIGAALPVIAWELFRFIEVGGIHGYVAWWRLQLGQILAQSGAHGTLAQGAGILSKGVVHFHILAGLLGASEPQLFGFLVLPWVIALFLIWHKGRQSDWGTVFCLLACGASASGYFLWWLFITPTDMAWLRRILDGVLLQEILLVTVFFACLSTLWLKPPALTLPRKLLAAGAAAILVLCAFPVFILGQTLTSPPMATQADHDELRLAQDLKQLPTNAVLFGFGWWKAPVLTLFSGRTLMNFDHWDSASINALPVKYLVVDEYSQALAAGELSGILAASTYKVIAKGPGGAIYELYTVKPYAPFTANDLIPAQLRSSYGITDTPYFATRGLYAPSGGFAWASSDWGIVLKRTDQTRLVLNAAFPSLLVPDQSGTAFSLHITSPGCLDVSMPIQNNGAWNKISLPLRCPAATSAQALVVSFHFNGHARFLRQIDADQRRLGFLFRSVSLQ